MPNEPPTWSVNTRTLSRPTPSTPAMWLRKPNTPWQPICSVQWPRLVVFGDGRARLDRVDDDAVVAQVQPGDMRGLGEGGGDLVAVAEMEVEPDIAGHVVVELRRAGRGRLGRAR